GRAHMHLVHTERVEFLHQALVHHGAGLDDDFAAVFVHHVNRYHTAEHAIAQRSNNVSPLDHRTHGQTVGGTAIVLSDHQVLGNIYQTARQVTGVGCLQRRVRQPLTGTVGRGEILHYAQTLAEVCRDRRLDNGAVGTRHQTTHTRQLADLCGRTTSTGVSVNVNGVERLLTLFLALLVDDRLCRQAVHHGFGNKIVGAGPDVDDLVVLLALRHQTGGILVLDLFNFRIRLRDDRGLFLRNDEVIDADGRAGTGRVLVTGVHQLVSEDHGLFQTDITITGVENAGDLFLGHLLVDHRERQPLRDDVEQQHTADSGFHHLAGLNLLTFTVVARAEHTRLDARLQMGVTGLVGTLHLGRIGEDHPLSLGIHTGTGHVVQPQNNVLGRHDDRFSAGGRQNVVGGHHQRTRFQLSFQGPRHVNGHLVTVEVGVIGSTDQRMQLDGLTFNQNGLERLDTESVQRWRTVEQYRVLPDHIGQ